VDCAHGPPPLVPSTLSEAVGGSDALDAGAAGGIASARSISGRNNAVSSSLERGVEKRL